MAGLKQAFLEQQWALMRADAGAGSLQSLMSSTPRIYLDMAEPDAAFPYVVQSINVNPTQAVWAVTEGLWLVDAWDYGQNKIRISNIEDRIKALFDRRFYKDPAGDEFVAARIWFINSASVPTDAERVWRIAMQFGFRLYAKKHAAAVIDREGA